MILILVGVLKKAYETVGFHRVQSSLIKLILEKRGHPTLVPFAQFYFFWVGFIGFKELWNPQIKTNTRERKLEVPDGIIKLTQLEIGHLSPKGEGKYFHSFSKTGWGCKLESKFWAGLQNQYC